MFYNESLDSLLKALDAYSEMKTLLGKILEKDLAKRMSIRELFKELRAQSKMNKMEEKKN